MNQGVIYVATGERFLELATLSCKSLRTHEPTAKVVLFTESYLRGSVDSVFDDVMIVESPQHSGRDKIGCCLRTPFEETLYLDCDTHIMGTILDEMFRALEFSALVVRPGMGFNFPWETRDYPECINQFNTGVIAFRKTGTSKFFSMWQEKARADQTNRRDQPSFRAALLESGIPYSPLSAAYNFMATNRGEIVVQSVKIVHFVGTKNVMLSPKTVGRVIGRYEKISGYSIVIKGHVIYDRKGFKLSGLIGAARGVAHELYRRKYRGYFKLGNYLKRIAKLLRLRPDT